MYIIEIPQQRRASAYEATEDQIIERAFQSDYANYGAYTMDELIGMYGEDAMPVSARSICKTHGSVVRVDRDDGGDSEFHIPGDPETPSRMDWAREVVSSDLHGWHEFETLEAMVAWARYYEVAKGHQWVAVSVEVDKLAAGV